MADEATDTVSIAGLEKEQVLAGLYNASRPLGMGFLHYTPEKMTPAEAAELLEHQTYFDYVKGRVLKVDLSGDVLQTHLYDRDNGRGAAAAVVERLRSFTRQEVQVA